MTEADVVERVAALLEEERAAVLAADFDAMSAIAGRKEPLFVELREAHPTEACLGRLRRMAEENAGLLAASARGIRSVTRRIAEIRSANGPLRTYSQDGRAQTAGVTSRSLERRA
ncbi:flagellar protein FlgN [Roseitranquillus sediminis]|uniref:flagellar protein FlgN n=1 Tax=Roseitranquillus sediminis TaxID=2809051 RepID=UPI001D0C8660|nr:flagellar protein FlgN [Roseitranquillus sediminis]MBM9596112.1 hypothetical protein [Roseitranquillus sediminis]